MRERLTPADVWLLMCEGCNAAEIAAFAGVSHFVAVAMMAEAARLHANGPAREQLRRAA